MSALSAELLPLSEHQTKENKVSDIKSWLDWLVAHKIISRTQAKRYARMDKRGERFEIEVARCKSGALTVHGDGKALRVVKAGGAG
tara:strand:+ start:411 stop:668 length:258 start_codon:yes stop_codon:yes gene_type:complete